MVLPYHFVVDLYIRFAFGWSFGHLSDASNSLFSPLQFVMKNHYLFYG